MKKFLSVLLAVLMLLSLVACGEDNKPASSVNNTPATSTVESKDESSEVSSETAEPTEE